MQNLPPSRKNAIFFDHTPPPDTDSAATQSPRRTTTAALLTTPAPTLHQLNRIARQLTIFHCKHLKVLNGTRVDPDSSQRARNALENRLSIETLEELFQCELHPSASLVMAQQQVLDLSNLRLRDLGDVDFTLIFPQLKKLVLDGNAQLSEVGLLVLQNWFVFVIYVLVWGHMAR